MIMEETNIPDYKLNEGFLKEFMFEVLEKPSAKEFTIKLPVFVQVIKVIQVTAKCSRYYLADGEFEMSKCVFMSKQTRPECFSILKVNKISKLIENSLTVLGVIEFDTVVSGEEIGFPLYKDLKYMNMKELIKRKQEIGLMDLKKTFETPKPVDIMKHMWENRSETLCDVNFTFDDKCIEGDGDSDVIYAHRSVLVAASEVFKAHSDNVGFIDNKSVHIVDSSFYSFSKLLEFIYTGKVQFTSWKLAFELLYLSKKYLMSNLENICQRVIEDFSNYDGGNLLNVFEKNQETNDEMLQNHVEYNVRVKIYEVINSKSFLNCEFSTVEWILSMADLVLDEWSRLCAIYKWAVHNKATAFCQRMTDGTDEPLECLHALLECVHYENIDGLSLKRFLKLPKLPEIIDVGELKQTIFDSLLEDEFYLETGTNYYPTFRGFDSFYVEIEIGNSKDMYMKNIPLCRNGPVLGFKIKIEQEQDNLDNGDHSLDIVLSFQYLYSFADNNKDIEVHFDLKAITTKSRIFERNEDSFVDRRCRLSRGKWRDFILHLEDCRGYLSSKIEDFSVNCGSENKSNIISLELELRSIFQPIDP